MELRMSWNLALALGAVLPRDVHEHRAMLRAGGHIRIRLKDMGGLAMFWAVAPPVAHVLNEKPENGAGETES